MKIAGNIGQNWSFGGNQTNWVLGLVAVPLSWVLVGTGCSCWLPILGSKNQTEPDLKTLLLFFLFPYLSTCHIIKPPSPPPMMMTLPHPSLPSSHHHHSTPFATTIPKSTPTKSKWTQCGCLIHNYPPHCHTFSYAPHGICHTCDYPLHPLEPSCQFTSHSS